MNVEYILFAHHYSTDYLVQTIQRSKKKFLTMRDATRRDRMAAEIEIKVS